MERSGGCRSLFRCEGLTDAQPREGEPDGGHGGAESLGGGALELAGGVLAGVEGFGGGCNGHVGLLCGL